MTDLNKANPLGIIDLFSNNLSCSSAIDNETLTSSAEKEQNGMINSLPEIKLNEQNAFVLLLTHIATKISNKQETTQNLTPTPEEAQQSTLEVIDSTIDLESETLEKKSEDQSISEMENNVAISWINSQYCQPHEGVINRINTEQEHNPIKVLNNNISMEQPSAQPIVIEKDENGLLQNAEHVLNSDSQHIIKDTFLNPIKTAINKDSVSISLPHVRKESVHFDSKFSYWENKEMHETLPLQQPPFEIENQTETAAMLLQFVPIIESADEVTQPSIVNTLTTENILTQDAQPSTQPILIEADGKSLLQNAEHVLNSDSQSIIKDTPLNPVKTATNNDSTSISLSPVRKESVPFDSKFSYWENKEAHQTSSPQQPPFEIESQMETVSTMLQSAPIIDSTGEVTLPSMVNILVHEPNTNGPMENHRLPFDPKPQALAIPVEIDKPEWSKQFSDHIIWLGQQEVKSAIIKINPKDLGPLEISIKVINDSASVNITTQSHHVRDIIDQSLLTHLTHQALLDSKN